MLIRRAYKYRIYPTKEQESALAIQFGHSRFTYNRYLDLRKQFYFATGETFSYTDCANDLVGLKKSEQFGWLKQADSQVLQQSLKDLDRAYQNFFRMAKEGTLPPQGKKPRKDGMPKGYPTFKSKHDDQSIRYPQRFRFAVTHTYLPKVGWVRTVFHRPLEGIAKNVTVSKTKTGKYFVSVQCEVEIDVPARKPDKVGVDLGLKDFVALSDGRKVKAPKYLRKAERRSKIRQRRLSRKQKGSNNRNRARHVVAVVHETVRNRRLDVHHKLSRQLVDEFGVIAFEDLNIQGMLKNHNLAKSIADAGWSQFVRLCQYKAAWAGGETRNVDRFFPSSQLCSVCGGRHSGLKLSGRTWQCADCGTIHDRDVNAANNILNGTTVGATESYALGDMSLVGDSAQEAQAL